MHCGDTTFFIDLFDSERPHHQEAKAWYDDHENLPLFAPAIVYWELYRGAVRVSEAYTGRVEKFMADVNVLPLTEAAALEAARIEQETRSQGEQLEKADCIVAGTVREAGGTLVTGDSGFEAVEGLSCLFYRSDA